MSNALEVLKRIVREEYKNIKDGVNIHPDGFRDYTKEKNSDFDEPHSTEKMESVKEELLSENPAASAAAAMIMMQMQNPDTGKKIKAITPLKDKDHKLHNKAKDIFKRLKDKFSKKKEPRRGTVHNYLPKDYKRESVNEARSTNREWNKFEKAFGDFFTTVLRLGKANTKVTGDKTDEKIFIKNFNRDVGKFYSLMQSWVRGQNESVNEECCDNCKEGKTCCSVKKDIKEIINEAKFTDDTLVIRLKHWSKQHKGTGIGYGHVLGQLAVHMKDLGWNKSYKEVARIAVELGKKRKVESVNEAGMGILTSDQADVLQAIVMRNKNKNIRAILKIALKDSMFKNVDKKELLGYIDGARQFVKYM